MLRTLSDEQIIRTIRAIRYSPRHERNARRSPSINGLAVAAGLTRAYLHMIASGERSLGPRARRELSRVLTCQQHERERAEGFRPPPPRRPD